MTAAVGTVTRTATKRPDVRSVLKASRAATVTRTSTNVSPATRVTNTPTVATQLAPSNASAPPDSRSSMPRPVRVRLDTHGDHYSIYCVSHNLLYELHCVVLVVF